MYSCIKSTIQGMRMCSYAWGTQSFIIIILITQKVNIINYTKLLQLMTMDHDVVLERLELEVPVQLGRYFAVGEGYRFVSLLPGQL